ncbi:MAG: SpoVG family protein [Oscillospiraceae bacterium]|nr:SpoVG family protein [Oscillospiraceae bacterium]
MDIIAKVNVRRKVENKILANASITLNNELVVTGIQIVDGAKGIFVSMPQYRDNEGQYHDRVYSLTKEMRDKINNAVLEEFENQTNTNAADNGDDEY